MSRRIYKPFLLHKINGRNKMLNLTESFEVLKQLKTAKTYLVRKQADLSAIKFPYYMKIDSCKHKKKIGGVIKCENLKEAKEAYSKLIRANKEQVVIQEEISGLEIILGIKEDKVFGKILLIGLGGESLDKEDIVFRAVPIKRSKIGKAIKTLRGYSKIKNLATEKLLTLIEMFLVIVEKEDIVEADLNPIILTEKNAVIVDARIRKGR
jgi:acyl-CoA synthetase (NDP forming)